VGAWSGVDNLSCSSGIHESICVQVLTSSSDGQPVHSGKRKGCAVAPPPPGKAATTNPSYLRTAEVAEILYVSPKTVSRWAKEGRLPFLKTLGGHRRYPEAEIRELAKELHEEATA
jgi:excisionase family DNA binding protein